MNNKKPKKKINKANLWAIIISCLATLAFICLIVGIGVLAILLRDKPTLNLQDFEQTESSVVYDCNGQEIANLGTVIRQNVEYNELPNCVVDAFVSIEDSRFFEHNGFDLPRFTKALLENIRTMSFGQGGSTFTMQLVKNTYFTNDDTGEEASRSGVSGVRRKVQEIALALELEKYEPKQFIFESYINKLNFGGDYNIRGIQKASQYYFSKDVSELNLNEAAMLAGVINAPNYYNPFYNLEAAQEREEQVLYQMYNHGYIDKNEYEIAKSVKVENLLADPYKANEDGEGIKYQAYVDAVVNEVINITGMDPYTTTMNIYTYMNPDIQDVMDDIQGQTKEDYVGFPDDFMECASVCIDNSTGQVVGILGGRNYSKGGQLLLNHATEQYKQPGSSIKPILDYALAFENLGWSTSHVLCDRPMYLDATKQILVYNFSNTYVGDVTLKQAVGDSINTCAIQTLQQVLDKMKYEHVVNYTQSLGYKFTLDEFNVQYGIGGSTCEVTPFEHAAAYAAIFNSGRYNTPHTVSRIEFTNGKSPVTPVYQSQQVISAQAAYLTTDLMKSNVQSYGGSYSYVKNDKYTVYGKTGTTDWGTSGKEFGIPSGANKDAWLVAATSEYTTATWVGYEKAVLGQPSYITDDCYYNIRPQARIAHLILDACYEYGDTKPTEITKPDGITNISHIIGTYPYASTNVDGFNVPEELIISGMVKTDLLKMGSIKAPTIEELKSADAAYDSASNILDLTWKKYPKPTIDSEDKSKDISLVSSSGDVIVPATGKCLFDESWIYGSVKYKADVYVGDKKIDTVTSSEDHASTRIESEPGKKVKVDLYYQFDGSNQTSNKISKDCGTSTISFKVPSSGTSKDELKEFASRYSPYIEFNVCDPSDKETFVFHAKGSSKEIAKGETIKVTSSSERYVIDYYPAKDYKIEISKTDITDGIRLTASLMSGGSSTSADFRWDYSKPSGLDITENGNTLDIIIENNDSYEFVVTAYVDDLGLSKNYTVTIVPSN